MEGELMVVNVINSVCATLVVVTTRTVTIVVRTEEVNHLNFNGQTFLSECL